jgi:hypothetical protein
MIIEEILGLKKPKPPIKSGARLSYPRMTKKRGIMPKASGVKGSEP